MSNLLPIVGYLRAPPLRKEQNNTSEIEKKVLTGLLETTVESNHLMQILNGNI
jgi:hypothetical protein